MGVLQSCLFLFQGYYRAGYSLLRLLQPYEAAHMFFEGLQLLQDSQDQTQVADFLVGIFTTVGSKSELGDACLLSSLLLFFKTLLFYLHDSWGLRLLGRSFQSVSL